MSFVWSWSPTRSFLYLSNVVMFVHVPCSVVQLQFKYKRRIYKQSQVNSRKLKHLHSKVCGSHCLVRVFCFVNSHLFAVVT